jgi:hypothetical protein
MFVLHELASGSAAYHVPAAWRLQGSLDSRALRTAFNQVVASHKVLGLTVISDAGQLHPLHGRTHLPELTEVSLQDSGVDTRLAELDQFLS